MKLSDHQVVILALRTLKLIEEGKVCRACGRTMKTAQLSIVSVPQEPNEGGGGPAHSIPWKYVVVACPYCGKADMHDMPVMLKTAEAVALEEAAMRKSGKGK